MLFTTKQKSRYSSYYLYQAEDEHFVYIHNHHPIKPELFHSKYILMAIEEFELLVEARKFDSDLIVETVKGTRLANGRIAELINEDFFPSGSCPKYRKTRGKCIFSPRENI